MANEVVKYNNKFNQVVFQNFTENELSLLMAICSKLKGKGTDTITLTFDQIKVLMNEKQHYTVQGYAEMIDAMYRKLINLAYYYNDGKDVAGAFHLFQGYERSISDKEVQIAVTPQFLHLFNSLEREFTRFELEEFVNLSGKYTKLLYRQLKQWRTQGHYSVLMKEFRELMDVPESYTTRDITKRIIVPSVDRLLKLKEFHFLRYKYSYKGKKAIRIIFTWHPETIPHASASEPASGINSPSTLDLLREKQKKDPFHYETEGESEDIPGMPGYKFAEEEDTNEIGEDELPF